MLVKNLKLAKNRKLVKKLKLAKNRKLGKNRKLVKNRTLTKYRNINFKRSTFLTKIEDLNHESKLAEWVEPNCAHILYFGSFLN